MIKGTKAMAQRIANAENLFISTLIEVAGITESEAVKVLEVYRKAKVVKLDPVGGRINVKHGGFWDADVIRRAINGCAG